MLELLFELANRVGLIIMISFVFSRTKPIKGIFAVKTKLSLQDKLIMALVFGGLGILGSLTGIAFKGAIVNTRVIGVVVGGLLGGPVVGILSGILAGLHRYLIDPQGLTSFACAISTIAEGLLAGFLSERYMRSQKPVLFAWIVGTLSEMLQMVIILLLATPLSYATNLVSIIAIPMIIMNAIGIAVFIAIIQNIKRLQDSEAAMRAQQTLRIADQTLQYFRQGLDEAAKPVAELIYEMTDFEAVAITDKEKVIANVARDVYHDRAGYTIGTDMTRHVLKVGTSLVNQNTHDLNCLYEDYQLNCAIIVPLKIKSETVGTLKLYKEKQNSITIVDEEVARGLAKLFSTQLELSQIEKEARLRTKAELKALQAQINPHFLFNAINTIVSLVRTSPDEARGLLIDLGDYFRKNLQVGKEFISIKDEMKHIEAYLKIEKARFGDKLQIIYDMPNALDFKLPPLLLQPIVENAVKHGVLPKEGGGHVTIQLDATDEMVYMTIMDDGVGMNEQVREEAVGLRNVEKRLKAVYGQEYQFEISSEMNQGTVVSIGLPRKEIR